MRRPHREVLIERRSVRAPPDAATASLPLYWCQTSTGALDGQRECTGSWWTCIISPLSARMPAGSTQAASTPWVSPGTYTVKLTVNGKSYTQPSWSSKIRALKTPAAVMQQLYFLDDCRCISAPSTRGAASASLASIPRPDLQSCSRRRRAASGTGLADFDKRRKRCRARLTSGGGRRPWRARQRGRTGNYGRRLRKP